MDIDSVPVKNLHTRLGFNTPLSYPPASLAKPLVNWRMETDDAPIFRFIYRHVQPKRHLEFGTWLGTGATYCLEESAATVWTINVPDGEVLPDGRIAYCASDLEPTDLPAWLRHGLRSTPLGKVQSDTQGLIGLYYLKKGYGHRVCQILCDSRMWEPCVYPPGFFDTVLVDGGHQQDVVASDTWKALPLLRTGGIMMWHDYCPDPAVNRSCSSTVGVAAAIGRDLERLKDQLSDLFWIRPSWILLGVKR